MVGLVLVVVAFPVLFWNEGRAVKTRKDLTQGSKEFVSVDASKIDSANEGRLIHLTAEAITSDTLSDEALNIQSSALVLRRKVEMFQWKEETETRKKKKLGGGVDTEKRYTYHQVWEEGRIESSKFRESAKHRNPQLPIESTTWTASPVMVGVFKLSDSLASGLRDFTPLEINPEVELPETLNEMKLKKQQDTLYLASEPSNPQIGDVRITYEHVLPSVVSIVSKQKGDSFEGFKGNSGTTIDMLMTGEHDGESMFAAAQKSNKILTWILRAVGFVVMFFGFNLIFKPLPVIADVLPIAGSVVGVGVGIVAFLLAAPLSLITISMAWIFYRPLIGIPLLILAGVGLFFLFKKVAGYKKSTI